MPHLKKNFYLKISPFLKVNWSVPQIRKQFQQRETANEPAPVIDTLYVKFPGGQQQRQINKKQQLA